MDAKQIKTDFDRDGFVIVRGFMSADDMAALCEQIDRYIRQVVPTLSGAGVYYDDPARPQTLRQLEHLGKDAYFAAYQNNAKWLDLAEAILGEPVQADHPKWFNKPTGAAHATPAHQDNYYFCLEPPQVITMWLALDKVDEENGCLRYLPGSHRQGVRPHDASDVLGFSQGISDYSDGDIAHEAVIRLEPGDLAIHHGEMVHRADANTSATRSRRSFAMVIRGKSCERNQQRHDAYLAALQAQRERKGVATTR